MSTGGSRHGAGRPGYRVKAEQLHRLDVRDLTRRGLLQNAGAFSWSWNRGGEPTGNIAVHVESPNGLTLRYSLTGGDVVWDVVEGVSIAHTPCPYGGSRPWFCCTHALPAPGCRAVPAPRGVCLSALPAGGLQLAIGRRT